MNRQEIDRICYRILLSIGDSLDVRKMLGKSVALYMSELACRMGAVLLADSKDSQTFNLTLTYAIPRNIEQQASFQTLRQELPHIDFSDDIVTRYIAGDAGTYYIMSVSDIGMLVLYKPSGGIDPELLEALRPINLKLGTAIKACIQNTEFQRSSSQFMEMANMLPGLIIELDQDYRVTFFNRRTQEIFKQIDSHEFRPKLIFDFFPSSELPRVRDLLRKCESGETMTSGDFWMRNSRDELFMVNLIISPISTYNTIVGFRGIAIDVSKRVKLEQDLKLRDRLLNAIALSTQELLKSNEYTEAIPTALELLGKAIGVDRVYYFRNSYNPEGEIKTVSQLAEWSDTHVTPQINNPELQEVPAEAMELFLAPLKERKPFIALIKDIPASFTKDTLASQNIQSILALPIFAKGLLWGFVGFDDCTSERIWSDTERDLLELFAISISEAIERKQAEDELKAVYREIMDDLDIAQTIQKSILPPWFHLYGDIMIASNYYPWSKIGGDLFDCVMLPDNRYVVYIADISGHGIQAALTMTAVKAIFSMVIRAAENDPSPQTVVTRLNHVLSTRLFQDNYMTMCYCLVDLNAMTVTSLSAGHPPLMIYHMGTGATRLLDKKGDIPVGWIADYEYKEANTETTSFTAEEAICLVTDGVFECFDKDQQAVGIEGLCDVLRKDIHLSDCIMLPHECYQALDKRGYTNRNDDYSFISLQLIPSEKSNVRYLEVLSQLEHVDKAAAACEAFVLQSGRSELMAFNTRLVASEFMNNIVVHGLEKRSTEILSVKLSCETEVSLTIRDNSPSWDFPPREPDMPDFFDILNLASNTHGRGVQIMHSLTKSVTRTRVHLVNETRFVMKDS